MPSDPVTHVFLTLQWNSLRKDLFEVNESQRDVLLWKLIFQMLLCDECNENIYT
jgi:formylmethanofuran dehydrogenase subunit E